MATLDPLPKGPRRIARALPEHSKVGASQPANEGRQQPTSGHLSSPSTSKPSLPIAQPSYTLPLAPAQNKPRPIAASTSTLHPSSPLTSDGAQAPLTPAHSPRSTLNPSITHDPTPRDTGQPRTTIPQRKRDRMAAPVIHGWSEEDVDVLLDLVAKERENPTVEERGQPFWVRVRRKWVARMGYDPKTAPSEEAVKSKARKSRNDPLRLPKDAESEASHGPSAAASSLSQNSLRAGATTSRSTFNSNPPGRDSSTSQPSTSAQPSMTLSRPRKRLVYGARFWSDAEDRFLLKLYRHAQAASLPSLGKVYAFVAKAWAKKAAINPAKYGPRTLKALEFRLYTLTQLPRSKHFRAAKRIRQEHAQINSRTSQKRAAKNATKPVLELANDEEEERAASAGPARSATRLEERVPSTEESGLHEGRESREERIEEGASGPSISEGATVDPSPQEVPQFGPALQVSSEVSAGHAPEAVEGRGALRSEEPNGGKSAAATHAESSSQSPPEGGAIPLSNIRARIDALERAQEKMRTLSARAWDEIKSETPSQRRQVEDMAEQLRRLPASVQSLVEKQRQLSASVEKLGRRVEGLERRGSKREQEMGGMMLSSREVKLEAHEQRGRVSPAPRWALASRSENLRDDVEETRHFKRPRHIEASPPPRYYARPDYSPPRHPHDRGIHERYRREREEYAGWYGARR